MPRRRKPRLSPLENRVMQVVWRRKNVTAEDVRTKLAGRRPLKDSTVRTILRRLEAKGYVKHTTEGRTYVYSPKVASQSVATDAVRAIVDHFCNGSVENLLVGMVDGELITPEGLEQLAERIREAEGGEKRKRRSQGE
jgi:BlaI family penicillinase repressor